MRRLLVAPALLCLLTCPAAAVAPPFPGITTATFASVDGPIPIPDAGDGALVSLLTVADVTGIVVDVDVAIDLVHPSPGQLDVSLISPGGTTVTLTSNNGGGNDDVFAGTVFDDQASGTPSAPNVRNFAYANLVPTGPIQPEEALGALVGEPAAGPWVLVVVDETGGSTGTLRSWSLTISTVAEGALRPSAATDFTGAGGAIPDGQLAGMTSTVDVAGIGHRLYDANVTVDIAHLSSGQLDLFLTGPSGRRIDLVTNLGGGNDDLYRGTTFDDQAGTPIADQPLPPSGTAFGTVVGEGALAAFLGEDPNGQWALTVVDRVGGTTGRLNGWTLTLVTVGVCGDGAIDAGEQCDDGNTASGDGCDANCTPTGCGNGVVTAGEDCDDGNTVDGDACPSSCRLAAAEADCGNCQDDDGNGLTDAADPACGGASLTLARGAIISVGPGRDRLALTATLPVSGTPAGAVSLVLADANGTVLCTPLGDLQPRQHGRVQVAAGAVGGGTIALSLRGGRMRLRGHGLDLSALDDPHLTVGLAMGAERFAGGGTFRAGSHRRRLFP